ncbi:hypothetical protein G5I_02362 [Acromyrmex echinatior]|uniref:Peptidase M10 metallopeptidase domain-containing protein n=1 Tax=Acromyrmex echinatior TaxID=103372 RepID=F4WA46_ACREC|nr:hypothetical protein G5I_02362 [Acromyrmex echinatior]
MRMLNNADIINYLMEQDDRDEQSTKKKKTVDESTDANPDKDNISNSGRGHLENYRIRVLAIGSEFVFNSSFQRKTLNPDILISYRSGTHTYADRKHSEEICSASFDGSGILAHAFYPSNVVNYTAEIHVDAAELWQIYLTEKSASNKDYLLNTLNIEDILAIQQLYGDKNPKPTTTQPRQQQHHHQLLKLQQINPSI